MKKRTLGRGGLAVSGIGYGAIGLSHGYGPGTDRQAAMTIRRAHGVQPVAAVQSEYSLWRREPETNGVVAACEDPRIGFVPFSPLGKGFLTGRIDEHTKFESGDLRGTTFPRFTPENIKANQTFVEIIKHMAAREDATPAQLALAWLLAQKPWIVPIPGTTKLHRLEENLGSVNVALTRDELRGIDAAAEKIAVHGDRYPTHMQARVGR